MLLALAGTLALTLVVVTSIRAARRKLRYEDWHLLHLYAYLGVGLALPHQLWTGQDFLSSPAATVYWWTLWAAAAGAILVWRVGVPLYRSARHGLVVERVVREGGGVVSVHHARPRPRPARRERRPVLHLALPRRPRLDARQPLLALRGADTDPSADHRQGPRRRQPPARPAKPGTRVLVEGPYGRHAPRRPDPPQGHPARGRHRRDAAARHPRGARAGPGRRDPGLPREQQGTTSCCSGRSTRSSAAKGARVYYALGPRIPNRRSWLPQSAAHLDDVTALRHLVPDVADHDVFICGAVPWMEAARDACLAAGVPPSGSTSSASPGDERKGRPCTDMRRNLAAFLGTLTALVLLFSYHTSLDSSGLRRRPPPRLRRRARGLVGSSGDRQQQLESASSSRQRRAALRAAAATKTYTGEVADTRWGPVQVEITVTNGKITASQTTQVPSGNPRDQEINSYAVPVLNQEAVQAQSAQIDAVSGATVTSDGYIQSLQSAIDQAHL